MGSLETAAAELHQAAILVWFSLQVEKGELWGSLLDLPGIKHLETGLLAASPKTWSEDLLWRGASALKGCAA